MDEGSVLPDLRLEDLHWLRELSRKLVDDPHLAEDAVQDTILVALTRRPRRVESLRAWLGAVLANAVRQERRGRARRREREQQRPERTAPSTLEVVEELAFHRRLVELVHALDEPYRRTLVQRYLHGKKPREIARAEGVPVKTVHTRVERGVARLRSRLDRDHGGERGAWAALLLPMLDEELLRPGLGSLLIPMNLKPFALVLGAAVVGALVYVPFADPPADAEGSVRPETSHSVADPTSADSSDGSVAAAASEERRSLEVPPSAAPPPSGDPTPPPVVHGFVRELDGRAVAGIELVFQPRRKEVFEAGEPTATSAADGSFSLPLPSEAGRLNVSTELYTALVRPYFDGSPPPVAPVLVVAPRRGYSGRVVDASGAPVANAEVSATLPGDWLQAFRSDHGPVHLLLPLARTRTDAHGLFSLEAVGFVDGAQLEAERDGFEPASRALPEAGAHDVQLVLERAGAPPRAVFGIVRDSNGSPVEGARVSLGWDSVRSGRSGEFALEVLPWQETATLLAVKLGFMPAARPFVASQESHGATPEDPIELYLGDEPRTIRGRVVDRDGEPVSGVCVWTPDTTYFGRTSYTRGEGSVFGAVTVEGLVTGRLDSVHRTLETWTDDSGAFELAGLTQERYSLLALQPGTLAAAEPVVALAGDRGLALVLEEGAARRVAGRVVARSGEPLPGVRVALGRRLDWDRPESAQTVSWASSPLRVPTGARTFLDRGAVFTDEDGRFELQGVFVEGSHLNLTGASILMASIHELDREGDLGELELVVDGCCRFRAVLDGDPGLADSVVVEDEVGRRQPLFLAVEDHTISTPEAEIVDGRSAIYMLREGEHTLVLLDGEREVERRTLELVPGGVTEVRF